MNDGDSEMSIGLTIGVLLSELLDAPVSNQWLLPAQVVGLRADIVRAIDRPQLLSFISDLAAKGEFQPKKPPRDLPTIDAEPSVLAEDWLLTDSDRAILRRALNTRIDERVQDYEAKRATKLELDLRLAREKLQAGRHTLYEASEQISAVTGEYSHSLLRSLRTSALSAKLPVYEPGRNQRSKFDRDRQSPNQVGQHLEAYWDDLNAWLQENEPRISFRFPTPAFRSLPDEVKTLSTDDMPANDAAANLSMPDAESEPTGTIVPVRTRRNYLDPLIDKAVSLAGGLDPAHVWLKLKEMALNSENPFLGTIHNETGALGYTDSKNRQSWLTSEALQKRLQRRGQRKNEGA